MPETNEDLSYLEVDKQDKKVLKNLSDMCALLKSLKLKALEAEAAAEQANKEYEHFANVILPQEMFSLGVDSMTLADGGKISIQRKYYIQPNKNDDDRKVIANWLRSHKGEHLIKSVANVDKTDIEKLKEQNIPFVEKTEVNSNALKSFLINGLGLKNSVQQFTVEEIPACIHFQEVMTAELEMPNMQG